MLRLLCFASLACEASFGVAKHSFAKQSLFCEAELASAPLKLRFRKLFCGAELAAQQPFFEGPKPVQNLWFCTGQLQRCCLSEAKALEWDEERIYASFACITIAFAKQMP